MRKNLSLNNNDLIYIINYAKGVHLDVIKEALNIDTYDELLQFKKMFKSKLGVFNDFEMIYKSYILNLFEVNDYFLTNWQNIAFGTAYSIYLCEVRNQVKGEDLKLIYMKILRMYVVIFKIYNNKIGGRG